GLLRGLSEKEIAAELMLSPRTVHKYVEHLFRHFQVNSRAQLMALWTRFPQRGRSESLVVHH
ncbi:MAG TPA: response regulator transcription factor, partial [Phycisphaerales bacterium]|nr:response regulator transcription factor [Phycisphaerales bacterium]